MINSFSVENPRGEKMEFDLFHPEPIGLYVKEIKGLGPPKADIHTMSVATWDGGVFVSSRAQQRNIVITLGIIGAPSVETARQSTYKYFPLKKKVKLTFYTDNRHVEIEGYVESNEPNIFSEHEDTQISIICPDPYFYEPGISRDAFLGVDPLFEFPFENPIDEPLLEFGEIRLDTKAVLTYSGDADAGVTISIRSYENGISNIRINNLTTQTYIFINTAMITKLTGVTFGKDDTIDITTTIGKRSAILRKGGRAYNILGAINKDADWFQLTQGDNVFDFVADSGAKDLMMTFTYRNAYGGI